MNKNIVIISNNCWGAEVYKYYNNPYNNPFVGLFIPPLCFVKFCNNIDNYLNNTLVFVETSKYKIYNELREKSIYPVALLDDVEIHFLHYKDSSQAIEKWNRRLLRMNSDKSNWRIKCCDREIDDYHQFEKLWNTVPYKKVFFSAIERVNIQDLVWISEFNKSQEVCDGMKLFKISKKYFNLNKFISNGVVFKFILNKVYSFFKKA